MSTLIIPRFIRHRDAPAYLGMDKNRFNNEVRPSLTEIPIGTQGIAYDRLDLDAWADDYKASNGRFSKSSTNEGLFCDKNEKALGTSRRGANTFRPGDFEKALELSRKKKHKKM